MTTKTLRALAKEYAEGILDKEGYRQARDAYFRAVLDGTVKVKSIDFRPPVEIQDLDATQEKTSIRPRRHEQEQPVVETVDNRNKTPKSQPTYHSSASPYLLISAVLLIIAAVGVSVALLKSSGNTGQPAVATNPPDESIVVEEKPEPVLSLPASPAETLIENFLRENNWSDSSLQQFKNDWEALTDAEQEQGLSSPMRAQLINAIHRKLIEERALLGLGDSENVVARQHKLVNFATELEINDPRLKVETE